MVSKENKRVRRITTDDILTLKINIHTNKHWESLIINLLKTIFKHFVTQCLISSSCLTGNVSTLKKIA